MLLLLKYNIAILVVLVGFISTLQIPCSAEDTEDFLNFFTCKNGRNISMYLFCNSIDDCGDNSDEVGIGLGENYINCRRPISLMNLTCALHPQYICNNQIICDEINKCDAKCPSHYRCKDGSCHQRSTLCDGSACNGCTEDHGWPNGVGFKCRKNGLKCILPQQLTWDNVADCDGNIDLCYDVISGNQTYDEWDLRDERGAVFNDTLCFKCLDNQTIIPRSGVCDGIIDCPDLSDECICNRNKSKICQQVTTYGNISKNSCQLGEFKCNDGQCLKRSSVCDAISDCDESEDESFSSCSGTKLCTHSTAEDHECRCSKSRHQCKLLTGKACNNVEDCFPVLNWGSVAWVDEGYPEDECEAKCNSNMQHNFTCGTRAKMGVGVPTSLFQCHSKIRPSGSLEIFDGELFCDGVVHCNDSMDENDCTETRFMCNVKNKNWVSIPNEQTCDGVVDCEEGEDEKEDLCEDQRFFCSAQEGKLVSIDKELVCDLYINCDDSSDEANCTWKNDRFYCENGKPLFVTLDKIKNGRGDCTDCSDECPSKGPYKTDNGFSSNTEMISNIILRVFIWVMAVLSLSGNFVVICVQLYTLKKGNIHGSLYANHVLILSLAFADLLMGIFLIILAIQSVILSGVYCAEDLNWRSSLTCTALGVLSTLSSEASIIMMVLLTSFRLYGILKPHLSYTNPKKLAIRILLLLAWTVALVLALLPLSSLLQNTFINVARYTNNPFDQSRGITLVESKEVLRNLLTFDYNSNKTYLDLIYVDSTWDDVVSIGKTFTNHPEYFNEIKYFGYYGQSVCIQKFFVTTDDISWKYSTFINVFNFLAFVYVAVAYVVVYMKAAKTTKKSQTNAAERQNKRLQSLQGKIIRLIVTDFCCWMPITVMAFVHLATGKLPLEAYAFAAIILLPINSALNPILYSDTIDKLYAKFRTAVGGSLTTTSGAPVSGTEQTTIKSVSRS